MASYIGFLCIITIHIVSSAQYVPFSQDILIHSEEMLKYGDIVEKPEKQSIVDCSMSCIDLPFCKAMHFNTADSAEGTCRLILSGCHNEISASNWIVSARKTTQNPCELQGTILDELTEWDSGCPSYYQLFDNDSALLTLATGDVEFPVATQPVNGKMYSFRDAPTKQAFLNLGTFAATDYCFPSPQLCPNGVSFAFWIYLYGNNGNSQGFITTMGQNQPGFLVSGWDHSNSLNFIVRRETEMKRDDIIMEESDFLADGFASHSWIHIVYTYKYDQLTGTARYVKIMGNITSHLPA